MRLPVLMFDIETITDLKAGAHLYGLDLAEDDLEQALLKLRRQATGSDFQRLSLHEIVCISGLWIDQLGALKLFSFSQKDHSEAEILQKFFSIFQKRNPTLVSWNGSQFDLPVILMRAMHHGLSAPSLFDQGEIDQQKRYNNYQNRYHQRHVDLMDAMSMFNGRHFQKLDDTAQFLGLPGQHGLLGAQMADAVKQQQWSLLSQYCETDVLKTWLIYLRWALLKGQISLSQHQHWIKTSIEYLSTQPQHTEFMQLWRQTSQQTAFTQFDFSPLPVD